MHVRHSVRINPLNATVEIEAIFEIEVKIEQA